MSRYISMKKLRPLNLNPYTLGKNWRMLYDSDEPPEQLTKFRNGISIDVYDSDKPPEQQKDFEL